MKKASGLTDNEIRVMIAEDQGWKWARVVSQEGIKDDCRGYPPNQECVGTNERYLPDYPADLNAMREVEMSIHPSKQYAYAERLEFLGSLCFESVTSTARQRCEAYLITKNLAK